MLDLVVADPEKGWASARVLRGDGHGGFAPALAPLAEPRHRDGESDAEGEEAADRRAHAPRVVHYGDLDGDGLAEVVTVEERSNDDAGMRESIAEAKRPPVRLRFYRTAGPARPTDLAALEPYAVLDAEGYGFEGSDPFPGGLQDLDGDGRLDLVTVTIDFSLLGAMRMMATHRVSLGLDFRVYCQCADGRFRAVPGLDLAGKFRLDLDDLRLERIAQFAGDFDGDGRLDYVQLGRGRRLAIHRGRPGCAYPVAPDLELELRDEPRDLALVQVRDLDGDGRLDLVVVRGVALRLYRGRPDPRKALVEKRPLALAVPTSNGADIPLGDARLVDLDGDGRAEIVTGPTPAGGRSVLRWIAFGGS